MTCYLNFAFRIFPSSFRLFTLITLHCDLISTNVSVFQSLSPYELINKHKNGYILVVHNVFNFLSLVS